MKKLFKLSMLLLVVFVTLSACSKEDKVKEWEEVDEKVLEDDSIYTGWLFEGKPHGEGEIEYIDASRFVGTFNKGELVSGAYYYANGDIYKGSFVDGKKSGVGYMEYITDCIYYGEFEDDLMHGFGYMEWPNGDQYLGEWKNGDPEGFGRKEFWNTENGWYIYEGDMVNGMPEGEGKMLYPNDGGEGLYEMYVGDFANGQRKGNGKFWFRDGAFYEGEFNFDWINGHGTFTYNNGNIFTGEFIDAEVVVSQEGSGTILFGNDEKYVGDITIREDGSWVRNGQGTMYFPGTWSAGATAPGGYNILRFEGTFDKDFDNGWINGEGTMYYINPEDSEDIVSVEGVWQGFEKIEE